MIVTVSCNPFPQCRGWTSIINDNLIVNVFSLGVVCLTAMSAALGALLGLAVEFYLGDINGRVIATAGMAMGAMGALLGFGAATMIQSAVATVFVCLAESSDTLRENHPKEHSDLQSAWSYMYPAASSLWTH